MVNASFNFRKEGKEENCSQVFNKLPKHMNNSKLNLSITKQEDVGN
jgi:hypothetical protein